MGVFICAICGKYTDSHDGGEALKPGHPSDFQMICVDCASERECEMDLKKEKDDGNPTTT